MDQDHSPIGGHSSVHIDDAVATNASVVALCRQQSMSASVRHPHRSSGRFQCDVPRVYFGAAGGACGHLQTKLRVLSKKHG